MAGAALDAQAHQVLVPGQPPPADPSDVGELWRAIDGTTGDLGVQSVRVYRTPRPTP